MFNYQDKFLEVELLKKEKKKEIPFDFYLVIENNGIWSNFSSFHKIFWLQEDKISSFLVLKGIVIIIIYYL